MTTFVPPVDQTAPGIQSRAPDGAFAGQRTLFSGVAAIGLIASGIGWAMDSAQFYFSYLVAYVFVMGHVRWGRCSFVLGATPQPRRLECRGAPRRRRT